MADLTPRSIHKPGASIVHLKQSACHPSAPSRYFGDGAWSQNETNSTHLSRAPQTIIERMRWTKNHTPSKDSLAARASPERDAQHTHAAFLAHTRRKEDLPMTFFADLEAKHRMVKESSKNSNNPFHTMRNPLPAGFGLQRRYTPMMTNETTTQDLGQYFAAAGRGKTGWILDPEGKPVSTPRTTNPRCSPVDTSTRPITSREQSIQCSNSLGNTVRVLVSMDVEERVARRAVDAVGDCTVASAMKWILDNEPGDFIRDLEKRWRARNRNSENEDFAEILMDRHLNTGLSQNKIDLNRTCSSHRRIAAAEEFLTREKCLSSIPPKPLNHKTSLGVDEKRNKSDRLQTKVMVWERKRGVRGAASQSVSDKGSIKWSFTQDRPSSSCYGSLGNGAASSWIHGSPRTSGQNMPEITVLISSRQPDTLVRSATPSSRGL